MQLTRPLYCDPLRPPSPPCHPAIVAFVAAVHFVFCIHLLLLLLLQLHVACFSFPFFFFFFLLSFPILLLKMHQGMKGKGKMQTVTSNNYMSNNIPHPHCLFVCVLCLRFCCQTIWNVIKSAAASGWGCKSFTNLFIWRFKHLANIHKSNWLKGSKKVGLCWIFVNCWC